MNASTDRFTPWLERTHKHVLGPGHYQLASGRHSRYVVDMRGIPHYVEDIIRELVTRRYDARAVDVVVGVPNGGKAFAELIARAFSMYTQRMEGIHLVVLVKEEAGGFSLLPGASVEGLKVFLVDDVGTTYDSILEARKVLEEAGAQVVHMLVVINRNENPQAAAAIGVEFLEHYPIPTYGPDDCPMCEQGVPLVDPNVA